MFEQKDIKIGVYSNTVEYLNSSGIFSYEQIKNLRKRKYEYDQMTNTKDFNNHDLNLVNFKYLIEGKAIILFETTIVNLFKKLLQGRTR